MARRRLRALQVEVTSRCSRRCAVCPRSALAARWIEGDLSDEHWERLRPDLPLVEHLHLQGWGEPLLHPRLESMVRDAHAAGCRVGLTSNGDLLAEAIDWIVAAQLDVVAVSVAGSDEWNRRLRDDARSSRILKALAEVARVRGTRERPRLHVSFLLVRGNAGDLPEVVPAAAASGADAVLVNQVECIPTTELRDLAAFSERGLTQPDREALEEADHAARALGVDLRLPAVEPQEMLTCALDTRVMTSVRWDGVVAPCIQLNLPISGSIPRVTEKGEVEIQPQRFGHLDDASLSEILNGDAYRSFVVPFERRCEADLRFREWGLVAPGWGVVALTEIDRAYGELEKAFADHPFPPPCCGCPKTDGW